MLVKISNVIVNLGYCIIVDLCPVNMQDAVEITFPYGGKRVFYGKDAQVLRWYLNHPTSDVIDIKNFKEG